ncbi:MAG: hypothetical protein U0S36_13255 [Candidatus Nanopelagicales bacterium]
MSRRRTVLGTVLGGAAGASLVLAAPSAAAPAAAGGVVPAARVAILAAAPAQAAPATGTVAVVGDSLLVGTLIYGEPSYLRRAAAASNLRLWPRPSAKVGRGVTEGLRILAARRSLPRIVLVELGTNNWRVGADRAERWIARARAIVGPDRDLYWVNVRMTRSKYAAHRKVNVGLARGVAKDTETQLAAGATGRSFVLDWSAYSRKVGVSPGRDGMHYGPQGYHVLARFVAGSIARHSPYRSFLLPSPEPPTIPMTPVGS